MHSERTMIVAVGGKIAAVGAVALLFPIAELSLMITI